MLTIKKIESTRPRDGAYKLSDQRGLYLQIYPSGKRSWYYKYVFNKQEKRYWIGEYPNVSLKEARKQQTRLRSQLDRGIDPGQAKKDRIKQLKDNANHFGVIAREYLAARRSSWTDGHYERQERFLRKDLAPLAEQPINDISAMALLNVLRRVEGRGAIATAHRVMQMAGAVFRYAIITGRAEYDVSQTLKGALQRPTTTHRPSIIEPDKVGQLMRDIEGYEGSEVVRCALQLSPFVFCRPGELRNAKWNQMRLEEGLWVLPVEAMKSRREDHIVPLSRQAVDILKSIQPMTSRSDYVFPSVRTLSRPMSDGTINAALRKLDIPKERMCAHGFRSMARTLLEEELNYPGHIINFQLSQKVVDPLGRAYNRAKYLKERRSMMQDWADYLDRLKLHRRSEKGVLAS